MEIRCPSCHTLVKRENINEKDGYALCDTCRNPFLLSDAPDNDDLEKKEKELEAAQSFGEIAGKPPKGVYIHEESGRITIGTKLRLGKAYIAIVFCSIVIGFIGFNVFGGFIPVIQSFSASGGNIFTNPVLYVFIVIAAPFLFVFGAFLISILMVIFGRVEVVIGRDSWIFTGIKNLGIKKRFNWNSVRRVYKRKWETTHTSGSGSSRRKDVRVNYEIIIEGKNKVNFGKVLNGTYHEQFEYILLALQYYHVHR